MRICGLLFVALLAMAGDAMAATRGPSVFSATVVPRNWIIQGKPYQVAGYRSARFGMDLAAVRAAIAKDFPGTKLSERDDPSTRMHLVDITAGALMPGPGAATVTYILGASSRRLAHVNIVWGGDPARLIAAAGAATADFVGYQWQPLTEALGVVLNDVLVPFAASDAQGGGVEVRLQGVPFDYVVRGRKQHYSPGTEPALLRIAYTSDVDNPDEYKIKPGEF